MDNDNLAPRFELPSVLIRKLLNEALRMSNNSTFQLSKKIKVSVSTVSMWYRAGAYPNLESLRKLEKYVYGNKIR